MRQNQKSGQYQKYQVRQPPNFMNYFKRMEQQKNRKKYQEVPSYSKPQYSQRVGVEKYERTGYQMINKNNSRIYEDKSRRNTQVQSNMSQYPMHKTDTINVFYEDRQQAKLIRLFQTVKPVIHKAFFFLFTIWFILSFVQPYKGFCPNNATCGVYIHCQNGFTLQKDLCVASKESKNNAIYICISEVENLKQQYGNSQCQQKQLSIRKPQTTVNQIISKYQDYYTINEAIKDQIYNWLNAAQNKKKYKFSFDGRNISPNEKKYDIFCTFRLTVRDPWYYPIYILSIVVIFNFLIWYRLFKQKRRANKIFQYLRDQVYQKNDIVIDLSSIQKRFGKVYKGLWDRVEELRIQDKRICYYEDQRLHWKLL